MHNYNQAAWRAMRHASGLRGNWRDMSWRRPKYNVPMNIIETEKSFEIHLYAVGFAKEDVKIHLDNDVLYIRGTRIVDENNLPNFVSQEYPIRNFERVVSIKSKVDSANISAKQEANMLIINLPKTEEAQQDGREIPIV